MKGAPISNCIDPYVVLMLYLSVHLLFCVCSDLLIVTTGDLEDITLKVIAQVVTSDLMRDTLIVERAELVLVIDLNDLLAASGWVRNVQLRRRDESDEGTKSRIGKERERSQCRRMERRIMMTVIMQ